MHYLESTRTDLYTKILDALGIRREIDHHKVHELEIAIREFYNQIYKVGKFKGK